MTQIIDPHLHLFDLNRGKYQWLQPSNPPYWPDKAVINRDFAPTDLVLSSTQTLAGFVHIEAGFDNEQPWREIAWLESAFTDSGIPNFKTIACVDLTLEPARFQQQLGKLLAFSSVVGVRHILDEKAAEIFTNPFTVPNLNLLSKHNLIFELQMPFTDEAATELVSNRLKALSNLAVVINHTGFPPLSYLLSESLDESSNKPSSTGTDSNEKHYNRWRNSLALFAQLPNVSIKCSGWEMNARQYSAQQVAEIVFEVIKVFGEEKVMLASNFPLTLFTHSYEKLWQLYQDQLGLDRLQFERLAHGNAKRIYRLS